VQKTAPGTAGSGVRKTAPGTAGSGVQKTVVSAGRISGIILMAFHR
jgi:hypothetical protein